MGIFYQEGREGIYEPKTDADLFILDRLIKEAKKEMGWSKLYDVHAKILFSKGEAMGYINYTESEKSVRFTGLPRQTLLQIFIRKKFRGHGFGQALVEDFLNHFPNGTVIIADPNDDMFKLLKKMGYVIESYNGWVMSNPKRLFFCHM